MAAKQHSKSEAGRGHDQKPGPGYYIGVDGGGSNTRVLVADETGKLRGTGHAGSSNRNHHSQEAVQTNLRDAFVEALAGLPKGSQLKAVFLGMCGVATAADRQAITALVRAIPEIGSEPDVRVENDTFIGLSGGLSGRPGLVLIAGTGSACYGRNEAGDSWLCGGWGALVDDVGSGHWLGLRAMQAAVFAEDGRGADTKLRELVFSWLGLSEPRQFLDRVHNQELSREDIAGLAPKVIALAADGDPVASQILREAATKLAAIVHVCRRRLFATGPCELVYVGGVARSGAPFQPLLSEMIVGADRQLTICEPELSPVAGAVLEALKTQGVAISPQVLHHIAAGVHSKT